MRTPPIGRRYALVTPCRNEADTLRTTLDTTIAQTVPPAKWVIVDDGSSDDTPKILAQYAAKHPDAQLRYDILSLFWNGRRFVVTHFADAFRPVADPQRPWIWRAP